MHEKLDITVILVSHSMEDIARLVDRIIVMHKSEVELIGTPSEVFKEAERLEKIGLAVPQVSYLMNALAVKGFNVRTDIFTVEEATKNILECFGR